MSALIFASTLWNDNTDSPGALNQGYIVEYDVNPFPPPADLIVQSLTHSPASPTTADLITFTAVVQNIGAATAPASTLMFGIGGETPGFPATLVAIPALAPGQTFQVQRQMTLIAQNYLNTAIADYTNAVAETNESNNTTTDSYTVTPPGSTPALLIDTGPASSTALALIPASAGNFQFIAARFTLTVPTVITSVEGWMGPVFVGGMNIQIRSDANGLPGPSAFSKSYAMVQASDTAWRSFPAIGITLNAGSYWLAFEPSTAFSSMPTGALSPLGKYATYFAPNGAYLDMLNVTLPAGALPSVGVRVWGMPVIGGLGLPN